MKYHFLYSGFANAGLPILYCHFLSANSTRTNQKKIRVTTLFHVTIDTPLGYMRPVSDGT